MGVTHDMNMEIEPKTYELAAHGALANWAIPATLNMLAGMAYYSVNILLL